MTIQIKNLYKSFSVPKGKDLLVLDNISLTIEQGDFIVILGESGCGKSTLLSILAGLLPVTSGDVKIGGNPINGPDPMRSIIFQQPSLLPWLNVEQNIIFGCRIRGDVDNLNFRVQQLIEIMGLTGFEKSKPVELSVGMAQRVCLARALIGHPCILLLDEPFSSLDTFNRTHLQCELLDFWQIEQFTAVFVTHDIDEAILLGNKIVLFSQRPGRIVEIFTNDLMYPRNVTDHDFVQLRQKIFIKLKETFDEDKRICIERGLG